MNLLNGDFLAFGGEPVTGRMPTQVHVDGPELTREQQGALAHAYKLFCDVLKCSITGGYQVQHRTLADGTQLRMEHTLSGDRVFVRPPDVELPVQVFEYFRGVPADAADISGSGAKPSESWRLPAKPAHFPTTLKPESVLLEHPGHVTWSNPNLKFMRLPIVLSWRGPRDRYATTLGWSARTGGTEVPHNETSEAIGTDAFTDSNYLWVNGRKIDTHINKIIAACLFCPDPIGAPGQFVVRVCTDKYPNGSSTRGIAVYDLVAISGATTSSLKAICEAKRFWTAATYVASDFKANVAFADGAGKWDMLQRPHFNLSGDHLATIIKIVDTSLNALTGLGIVGVSFDPTAWTIASQVDTPYTLDSSISDTTYTTTGPNTTALTYNQHTEETFAYLVAIDFDGDTLAYVKFTTDRVIDVAKAKHLDSAGALLQHDNESTVESFTWTITHSSLGTLATHTDGGTFELDYTVTFSSGHTYNITGSVTNFDHHRAMFALIGNLAKASFAIGYSTAVSTTGPVGSLTTTWLDSDPFPTIPVDVIDYGERLTFDVYISGILAASATTGAFTNSGSSSVTTSTTFAAPTSTLDSVSDGVVSAISRDGGSGMSVDVRASQFQHAAVASKRNVAYFGGAFPATSPTSGIELDAFNDDGTTSVESTPAYAAGTRPTISAPVFTGPSTAGASP